MNGDETEQSHILPTSNGFNIHVQEVTQSGGSGRGPVLLVNGAFASIRATRAIWSILQGYDLVLYDLPHVGGSKAHNDPDRLLSLSDEAGILADVVARCRPRYMLAMSWGGTAALSAMAEQRLPDLEKVVICSFSDRVTGPMREMLVALRARLLARQWDEAASLLIDTLGQHLHAALKRANHAYLGRFLETDWLHIVRHIERLLPVEGRMFDGALASVETDVLFMNGELDVYTPSSDAAHLAEQIAGSRVAVMANMGHFLGVESRAKGVEVARAIDRFLDDAQVTPGGWLARAAAPVRAETG